MGDSEKKMAAQAAAADLVAPADRPLHLGLGTGSTAACFVDIVGAMVADGFRCICVPTSERTHARAAALNIPLSSLDELPELDVTVDGTDEIAPDLSLIKGGGGALLREKIVAAASRRMVVIADRSKKVAQLGAFSLPIEVNPFGLHATRLAIEALLPEFADAPAGQTGLSLRRNADRTPFVTDGGHYIVDARFCRISNAQRLSNRLLEIPGVVQHGLFLDLCRAAYIAGPDGVERMGDFHT